MKGFLFFLIFLILIFLIYRHVDRHDKPGFLDRPKHDRHVSIAQSSHNTSRSSGLFSNAGAKLMGACKFLFGVNIVIAIAVFIILFMILFDMDDDLAFFWVLVSLAAAAVYVIFSYISLLLLIAFAELCMNVRDIRYGKKTNE